MDEAEQLSDFLRDLNQEIRQRAVSDGLLFEEAATRHLTDLLADVDLTADVVYCTESRQAGNIAYRINAFALSENDENLDLFVIQAGDEADEVPVMNTADLARLSRLPEQFLTRGLKGYLRTEIDPHSLAYELATKLHSDGYQPVRVRVFVLTNRLLGARVQGIEERRTEQGVLIQFHVWDLDRFYRTSTGGYAREPIAIDFVRDFDGPLPCLPMPVQNEDYQSFLVILPGNILADIYEKYGARLLEQNVRSFLQFGGKTNKGIRETIMTVPHRFLAYNNGLAATASEVEMTSLPQGGAGINTIRSLQIVNGGQTTASIFQTRRKDNISLDQVFVQMKLTVLRHADEMAVMVPLISRFANTQNAISSADLSANSAFNIELERISRTTPVPAPAGTQVLTRWFFERARGQYKVELARRLTKASRTVFERENPKHQFLTKESAAKYFLTWEEQPHIVANGAQKLYEAFTRRREKLPVAERLPDRAWFQDMVAQAILFQSAEKLYDQIFGRGGGYRALVVPYALSWLRYLTKDKPLSLSRIWRQQADPAFKPQLPIRIPKPIQEAVRAALTAASDYLITTSPPKTPREWATREACWTQLQAWPVPPALAAAIKAVPAAERATEKARAHQAPVDLAGDEQREQSGALTSLGTAAWKAIEVWGRQSHLLSARQLETSSGIARAIDIRRALSESEISNGNDIIDAILKHHPSLLADMDEPVTVHPAPGAVAVSKSATLDDVNALLEWDRKQKTKRIWPKAIEQLRAFKKGEQVFNQYWQKRVGIWVDRFREYGFVPEDYRD